MPSCARIYGVRLENQDDLEAAVVRTTTTSLPDTRPIYTYRKFYTPPAMDLAMPDAKIGQVQPGGCHGESKNLI